MIEVKGLTKYYGSLAAIQDVSFGVGRGEIIGFLGPNAAGKTTTMRILCGFFPASRGTARIAGFEVHENPLEVKRRVGYLPENVPQYPEMLVSKFLSYVAEVKNVPKSDRAREVGRAMERCGLTEMASRVCGHLSKGYRQRVGLAQALIGNPPVLILDEPTVGLDPKQIIEIRQMIKDLAQEHTVLLSTHILPEVAMICGRVLIIHQGRIVAQDSMENLGGASGTQPIIVEADGAEADVKRVLERVTGVTQVVCEGAGRYLVQTRTDTGAAIAEALVQARHSLRSLQPRTRTLEDVFVDAISKEGENGR
ncbi:MAG: ATP-binding cassette domain-containing protein [Candidatus Hydrogenedentes bacterium]|nr:ATP-binding cassette domain-containing protein [Candidatus Hydrogenedentota bacterium]